MGELSDRGTESGERRPAGSEGVRRVSLRASARVRVFNLILDFGSAVMLARYCMRRRGEESLYRPAVLVREVLRVDGCGEDGEEEKEMPRAQTGLRAGHW